MIRISFLFIFSLLKIVLAAQNLVYPVTKSVSQSDTFFGHIIHDPYRWLENQEASETKKWINEENELTQIYLNTIGYKPLLKEKIKKNTEIYYNTPVREGEYYVHVKSKQKERVCLFYIRKVLKLKTGQRLKYLTI